MDERSITLYDYEDSVGDICHVCVHFYPEYLSIDTCCSPEALEKVAALYREWLLLETT